VKNLTAALVLLSSVGMTSAVGQVCAPNPAGDLEITLSPGSVVPRGEPVTVTVTNRSSDCTYFQAGSCLFADVHAGGCDGPVVDGYICLLAITPLLPGESSSQTWLQLDQGGDPVGPGTYAFDLQLLDPDLTGLHLCPEVVVGPACEAPFSYGNPSPGTGGVEPILRTSGGAASVGNNAFEIELKGAVGGAPAVLFIGAGLGELNAPWGTFLLDPSLPILDFPLVLWGTPGAAGDGEQQLSVPIPADDLLVGAEVYLQALIADPGAHLGISHTQGLGVQICP